MFLNQGLDGSMGYEIRYQFPDLNILERPFQQFWKILRNRSTNEQILYSFAILFITHNYVQTVRYLCIM
jgi:hypothetical protein